ncbi:MAG: hypothetical protein RL427_1223 [Bacteroidota bacterium]|jgi:hypothetical protein
MILVQNHPLQSSGNNFRFIDKRLKKIGYLLWNKKVLLILAFNKTTST